ncbi:hypothetical protein Vretimale_315, partial [Volvox reticuliferus]
HTTAEIKAELSKDNKAVILNTMSRTTREELEALPPMCYTRVFPDNLSASSARVNQLRVVVHDGLDEPFVGQLLNGSASQAAIYAEAVRQHRRRNHLVFGHLV